ncbi:MAG: hypothetical protein ACP5EP_11225 [Acidobacteriaceae bacterium]
MGDTSQFETPQAPAMDCAALEGLLADAVENALPEAEKDAFAAHAASCAPCHGLMEQARQGHDWLLLLKQEAIEVPVGLVDAILARTSGGARMAAALPENWASPETGMAAGLAAGTGTRLGPAHSARLAAVNTPLGGGATLLPWRRPVLFTLRRVVMDPRLALTAAMAFFSISLTLDLLGVRLAGLHPADLSPQTVRRTLTRQYVQANAQVVRYYENLRFVYEVESRVQELRRASETTGPTGQPEEQQHDKSSTGPSSGPVDEGPGRRRQDPLARVPQSPGKHHPAVQQRVVQVPIGPLVDAALRLPGKARSRTLPQAAMHQKTQKILDENQDRPLMSFSKGAHGPVLERSAV